jgi:hypothetical protein
VVSAWLCPVCGQDPATAETCVSGDNTYRYGREPFWEEEGADYSPLDRCADCGVAVGWLHHPGCDIAVCESCDRQALMCDCPDRTGR